MVCTYSSDLFKNHSDETAQYLADFKTECEALASDFFKNATVTTSVEIMLLLLPIPDKDKLNTELDKRLKAMQSI